jgi:hypothetical protein
MSVRKPGSVAVRLPTESIEIARAVVDRHYPGEAEAFDVLVEAYEADPGGTVRGVRLGAPVGFGLELAAITPWVLTAVGAAGGVLVEKVAEDAYAAGRRWLSRVWARGRTGEPLDLPPGDAPRATILITVHLREHGAPEDVARQVAEHVVKELGDAG